MATRLLLLAAMCSLAACQKQVLTMVGSSTVLELDESKDLAKEPQYILKKLHIVTVQCSMAAVNNSVLLEPRILWHKAGSNETLDESRFQIASRLSEDKRKLTSLLTMRRMTNEDVANYVCTGVAKDATENVTAIAQLLSRPLITFAVEGLKSSDVSVWPGESLAIKCVVEGNPRSSVEWFREDGNGEQSVGNSSVLNRTDLSYERDRGFMICRSRNDVGVNSAKIYLRVKNPQAYLLPLLIIIGEVIVIGIIVLCYELYMRRKRSRMLQSESEPGAAYKSD